MSQQIAKLTILAEIADCSEDAALYGWLISSIDEVNQRFSVTMTSPIDQQVYTISIQFDNYPQIPLLIDFADLATGILGTPAAYPKSKADSFFHPTGCICHPCSRKSYAEFTNLHPEWSFSSWRLNAGGLINLKAILQTIYLRISEKHLYGGRMV